MPKEQRVITNRWKTFNRVFSDGKSEVRQACEIIFGKRRDWRYWTITTDPVPLPSNSTWYVMSHLPQPLDKEVGNLYRLRTWIEYGFKQCKNHLGWADFRLTRYPQIERWWEIVSNAYLLVSLQFNGFGLDGPQDNKPTQPDLLARFRQHDCWREATGWKHRLNNLQLIIQPYIYFCLLLPWLNVFDIPHLKIGLKRLITIMNEFRGWVPFPKLQPQLLFSIY